MGHACTHDHFPEPDKEHPVVAVVAIIAIVAAILLIAWARLAVHGTDDLQEAILEPQTTEGEAAVPRPETKPPEERAVESHVTSSRFATGFSP